jgi:hypothetical protein
VKGSNKSKQGFPLDQHSLEYYGQTLEDAMTPEDHLMGSDAQIGISAVRYVRTCPNIKIPSCWVLE